MSNRFVITTADKFFELPSPELSERVRTMTVGQLRTALEGVDDNAKVFVTMPTGVSRVTFAKER